MKEANSIFFQKNTGIEENSKKKEESYEQNKFLQVLKQSYARIVMDVAVAKAKPQSSKI